MDENWDDKRKLRYKKLSLRGLFYIFVWIRSMVILVDFSIKMFILLIARRKLITMNWKTKTILFLVGLILLAASPWVLLEYEVISEGWAIALFLVIVIPGIIVLLVWSLIRKSGKEHPEDIMDAAARKHGRWFSGVVIPFRLSFYLKMILTFLKAWFFF